jgi:protein-tyrosine phosphatase
MDVAPTVQVLLSKPMTTPFAIATITLPTGARIGICRLPLADDLAAIARWRAAIVVSLAPLAELEALGAAALPQQLANVAGAWRHCPVVDFGVPDASVDWSALSQELHGALDAGNGVLLHCRGGLGRSGMIALRLLVERGMDAGGAFGAVRAVRPGAVETDAQLAWGSTPT